MILPNRDILWEVSPEHAGQRLDRYMVHRMGHRSRSSIREFIQEGLLKVLSVESGHTAPSRLKPSTPVQAGMQLLIRTSLKVPPASEQMTPRHPWTVVHEDDDLLVVNKPAGMLVHPAGLQFQETLIIQLKETYGEGAALHLGHRLDKETSGVMVVAKGDDNNRKIKAAFKAREMKKGYLAIVQGTPRWERHQNASPMAQAIGSLVRLRQTVRPDGLSAMTRFQRLETTDTHALLACSPHTGRIHQIRVHLEDLGHAIVGDKIYGTDGTPFVRFLDEGPSPELEAEVGHWRQALHAHWIELAHPRTGEWLRFTAPLAEDLAALWQQLKGITPQDDGS